MRTIYVRPELTKKRFGLMSTAPLGFKIMFSVVAFFIASTFVLVIGLNVMGNSHQTVAENCKITGKHVAVVDGYSQYRISTANCGSFMIADNVFKGQFDSADVYGQLEEGKRYDITSVGYRIPVISAFPNMIDFKESGRF